MQAHGEDVAPQAAVAILHARGRRESILLIRRAERAGDAWSGHWSFPGGRRDPADPDLVTTALRELQEECGIRLDRRHLQAPLTPMVARRRTGPFLLVAPFLFQVERELPAVLDEREAIASLWFPLSGLLDPARHRLRPVPGLPAEMLYPAIDLDEVPLWGFTYRLITSWLGLIAPLHGGEHAAFELARGVLEFLLASGLALAHHWREYGRVRAAAVAGAIPVPLVMEHFSVPGPRIPPANLVEVRPDRVRIVGLEFEEYVISTVMAKTAP